MRYFLYTYANCKNWETTTRTGVFGSKKDSTGLPAKVNRLRRGDLIVIRDGSEIDFQILGCCVVSGDVFDQQEYSPYKDYLWDDEITNQKIIYPLRIPVEVLCAPKLQFSAVTWDALDALSFTNAAGAPLRGHQAWGKKFVGNFLESEQEVRAFSRLVGHEPG